MHQLVQRRGRGKGRASVSVCACVYACVRCKETVNGKRRKEEKGRISTPLPPLSLSLTLLSDPYTLLVVVLRGKRKKRCKFDCGREKRRSNSNANGKGLMLLGSLLSLLFSLSLFPLPVSTSRRLRLFNSKRNCVYALSKPSKYSADRLPTFESHPFFLPFSSSHSLPRPPDTFSSRLPGSSTNAIAAAAARVPCDWAHRETPLALSVSRRLSLSRAPHHHRPTLHTSLANLHPTSKADIARAARFWWIPVAGVTVSITTIVVCFIVSQSLKHYAGAAAAAFAAPALSAS